MIISLTIFNLHSTKPLHLAHPSVPSNLIALKNQSQNPKIPLASAPDDIMSPACQERIWEMIILRINQLKHWKVSQLTPHRQARILIIPIPRHTLTHAHSRAVDQHGVPVVGCPPVNEHTSPPLQNEPADNGSCSHHGVPMVGLVPPVPHPVTHPPHADQNDDIVDGTAESHCGVPTVGLSAIPQKVSSTHSHADLGSKEPVTFPPLS